MRGAQLASTRTTSPNDTHDESDSSEWEPIRTSILTWAGPVAKEGRRPPPHVLWIYAFGGRGWVREGSLTAVKVESGIESEALHLLEVGGSEVVGVQGKPNHGARDGHAPAGQADKGEQNHRSLHPHGQGRHIVHRLRHGGTSLGRVYFLRNGRTHEYVCS
eukprot:1185189-Prorocentrum_minimum.AAC.1